MNDHFLLFRPDQKSDHVVRVIVGCWLQSVCVVCRQALPSWKVAHVLALAEPVRACVHELDVEW